VVTRLAIWWYVDGRVHLLVAPVDARSRWAGVAVVAVPGAAYVVVIAIAETSPTVSLEIYATLPVRYFNGITLARTTAPPASAARDFS
jgi:hypothetical protein